MHTLDAVVLTYFHDDQVERGNSDAACTQQDNAQARDAAVGCLLGDRALNSVDEGLQADLELLLGGVLTESVLHAAHMGGLLEVEVGVGPDPGSWTR